MSQWFINIFGLGDGLLPVQYQAIIQSNIQLSAVIMRSNITLFFIWHISGWSKICIRGYIHKRHPMSCPCGHVIGCLLWGFRCKLTALQWHSTIFCLKWSLAHCEWLNLTAFLGTADSEVHKIEPQTAIINQPEESKEKNRDRKEYKESKLE